jgi:cell division septal protein FtsQ
MGSRTDPWIGKHPRWVTVIILGCITGCLYLVYGLPMWQVSSLHVTGQYTLPLEELRTITRAQQQSRWLLVFRQTNLWAFDTRAYERRLRERWMFSKLSVIRSVPRTITLHIVEEQPAYIYQRNDKLIGIDRNGVASTYLPALPVGIPQLTFLTPPEVTLNDAVLTATQATFLATFIGKIRERHDAKLTVAKVTVAVAPETTLRLGMVGEWEVIVDTSANAESQSAALLLAYDQKLKGKNIEYVDVSVPSRVYVK